MTRRYRVTVLTSYPLRVVAGHLRPKPRRGAATESQKILALVLLLQANTGRAQNRPITEKGVICARSALEGSLVFQRREVRSICISSITMPLTNCNEWRVFEVGRRNDWSETPQVEPFAPRKMGCQECFDELDLHNVGRGMNHEDTKGTNGSDLCCLCLLWSFLIRENSMNALDNVTTS